MKQLAIFLCLLSISTFAYSQAAEAPKANAPIPEGQVFITQQKVSIDGKVTELTAKAGTMQLRDEANEPIALFGFTSYTKNGEIDPKKRPIVFAFNGGPLSASFWLHMGILGPKRVVVTDPGITPGAPYEVVNNNYTILDIVDLVMIDPVGVGLSVPIGKAKFEDFWGVDQDIRSIGLFIEQYLIENGRLNSPKYLLGESYGTFRNAGLMGYLQDRGTAMNGVIMVSAVFELQHLLFPPGDDVAYLVHFPTYAATAWYHNKANKKASLDSFLDEVRHFVETEYAPALLKGDQLSAAEKKGIAERLAAFSGLTTDVWLRADLRITNSEFFQELKRTEGQTVGRLDSRYTGINQDLLSQFADHDPQSTAISPAYIAAFRDYFYNDLKVDKKLAYVTTAGQRKGFKWDWHHQGNIAWNAQVAINTAIDMATTMSQNPNVKVLILNGYYDIATVFYGVEHTINHMGLTPEIKKNIIMKYYEAGHMMYTHQPSLEKFREDVSSFIISTSK
ncbi:MAG: hypothetical protein R2828_11150 [Saprospiraceae bacterium]